jgi:hypothetical protein
MSLHMHQKRSLFVAQLSECIFVGVMLCSINIPLGISVGTVSLVVHALLSKVTGMPQTLAGYVSWFAVSLIANFVLVAGGVYISLAVLGLGLRLNDSSFTAIVQVAIMISGGALAVRAIALACYRFIWKP